MRTGSDIDESVALLHKNVAAKLKAEWPEEQIVDELVREGIEPNYAWLIIGNVKEDGAKQRAFWKLLSFGLVLTIGGLLINFSSYQIAAQARSVTFFYLFWGIVVTGLITICRAFILYRK